MSLHLNRRSLLTLTGIGASALALSACGASGDTALGGSSSADSATITIGSADFAESQIIAAIYAAALTKEGIAAETVAPIGAREAYIGALEEGTVGVVPDYSGNLLLYFDAATTASTAQDVTDALPGALPSTLKALEAATAENKDSMTVTSETAKKYGLTSIADLAAHSDELVLGAPPEFAERTYGLSGLKEKYGFTPKSFEPINDAGGPLTVAALKDGTVQVANLFSTDPAIAANGFVVLEDPKNNFLPQQVLPLVNAEKVSDEAAKVLNKVSAVLTTEHLIELNTRVSGDEKANPADAAADWVEANL